MRIKLYLAPLAGVTDSSFRTVCRSYGADIVCTEMISSRGIYYKDKKTEELLSFDSSEQPIGIQIFGCEPDIMAYAAKKVEERNPAFIDINMGCPMPKIVNNGDGCAMMKDPIMAGRVINAVVRAVNCPVSVKFRAGYKADLINAPEIARVAQNAGASFITVHPRTAKQLYSGTAKRELIAQIKQSVNIPVIGNGDIFSPESARDMLDTTGCDGLMIARGALGNPFIFKYIKDFFDTGVYHTVTLCERIDTALFQLRLMCEKKPERIACAEARKHLAWYLKGVQGAAKIKDEIMKTITYNDIERIMLSLKESNPEESRC